MTYRAASVAASVVRLVALFDNLSKRTGAGIDGRRLFSSHRVATLKTGSVMKSISTVVLVILLALVSPATAAPDVAKPVIEQIEQQGYSVTEVSWTWLGRILISAKNETSLREVVLNRITGQVVSDRAFPLSGDTGLGLSVEGPVGGLGKSVDNAQDDAAGAVGAATGDVSGSAAGGVGGAAGAAAGAAGGAAGAAGGAGGGSGGSGGDGGGR